MFCLKVLLMAVIPPNKNIFYINVMSSLISLLRINLFIQGIAAIIPASGNVLLKHSFSFRIPATKTFF